MTQFRPTRRKWYKFFLSEKVKAELVHVWLVCFAFLCLTPWNVYDVMLEAGVPSFHPKKATCEGCWLGRWKGLVSWGAWVVSR